MVVVASMASAGNIYIGKWTFFDTVCLRNSFFSNCNGVWFLLAQ